MICLKKAGMLVAITGLIVLLTEWYSAPVFAKENANEIKSKDDTEQTLLHLTDHFYVEKDFSSHLPLLVLRMDGITEFYTGSANNQICEEQLLVLYAEAAEVIEEDPALHREKANYLLTITEDSQSSTNIMWDGAVSNNWLLLGNMYDKSLLRDYLALSLARELDNDVPQVQYCEVLIEDEIGLLYQGVYLLVAPPESSYYYLDRYQDTEQMDGTLLYTYAFNEGILTAGLHVEKGRTFTGMERITLEHSVSIVENVIYSKDYNHFAKYPSYINEQSFIDYFIINELFGNYTGASHTTYIFDLSAVQLKSLITPGFEFSLDNDPASTMIFDEVELLDGPYYSQLNQSTIFLKDLLNRYRILYQDTLKSSNLEIRIDETVRYLGDARKRDWARWNESYSGAKMFWLPNEPDDELSDIISSEIQPNRNTFTYEQEIIKLKFTLREHGQLMFAGIATYYKQDNMIGEDAFYVKNTYLLLGYFTLIILSVRIVRRLRR